MIFLIAYVIQNGERKYIIHHTKNARNKSEAQRRAVKYISDFYSEGTHPDDTEPTRFWREDETESIELIEIERVTAKQMVNELSIDRRRNTIP